MNERYVFPDIHGCMDTLQHALEKLIRPDKKDELYFTGDFINKGPDSKGVLDYILRLIDSGFCIRAVRGNHEQMLLKALENRAQEEDFIIRGGLETLDSFGISSVQNIPEHYIDFIKNLPFFIELENYYIVHAGFDLAGPEPFEDKNAMLTIRNFEIIPEKLKYKKVIHGHFATSLQEILYNLIEADSYDINIDNGCVYTHRVGMGNMFILNLNDLTYHIQPCLDQHDYENSVNKRRHYPDRG